jgi:triosephosphate isomerase (TIM)
MRTPLIAGNWKMYGSLARNAGLLDAVARCARDHAMLEVAVCVPFPYLSQAQTALSGSVARWGAQNLSEHKEGAYTGEVGGAMLAEFGCRYVIVGHSERRTLYGEDDATVARKYAAAQACGLVPIFCVGETLSERDAGATMAVVGRQLDAVLSGPSGAASLRSAVVAYEPVWAIGTGRTATPEQAQDVHAFIRARVAQRDPETASGLRILYGGSVKAGNAAQLLSKPDVDGGLVGGASLVAAEFAAICAAAATM